VEEDRLSSAWARFHGLIISVTKFGFFVELEELFVEGWCRSIHCPGTATAIMNARLIIGDRIHRQFRIGDRVPVRLDRIDGVGGAAIFRRRAGETIEEKEERANAAAAGRKRRVFLDL
jgi:exoribonuclease R